MEQNSDPYQLAHYGLNLIDKKSSDIKCAEIYFEKNKYINIEIEENSIKNSEIGQDYGFSIRVINSKGSLGFAYTNKIEKKAVKNILEYSIQMMKAGTEDPDFHNLPYVRNTFPIVKDLFDKNIKNLQINDSINYIRELIKVCEEDELAISQTGSFISNYTKTYIFNSNGLEISGKDTSCSVSSHIIVKDKISKDTSFGYEWQSERNLKNINASETAENALKDAKKNLNRKKIKNMKVPLVLTPKGTINLILRPIALALNAETFQHKRSFLYDKRDEIIGSQYLTIEDNGLIDGAIGSSIFDGEGVPCKNKEIFIKGRLLKTGLLHNSYTAGKESIESTGNASRNSYSSTPSIGITNFIMKKGDINIKQMIGELNEAIILDYTGDSPNITTGDFSGLILHGNIIKNGEIKNPLNETMIGINLMDLFQRIDAVSNEVKVYGSFQAPYVRIKDVQIIGGAD
ncbi:MAG: TldD/PmbA family protein [Promethearchaeota archaeon]